MMAKMFSILLEKYLLLPFADFFSIYLFHLILIGLFPEGAATGANERQHESLQRGGLQDDDW
jgi:hypothetical protein